MRLWSRVLTSIEGVGIALDAIRSNKVRAGLTILGIMDEAPKLDTE